jgi:hypothetical protein
LRGMVLGARSLAPSLQDAMAAPDGQAGPTSWATSEADRPTYGSPAPGVA